MASRTKYRINPATGRLAPWDEARGLFMDETPERVARNEENIREIIESRQVPAANGTDTKWFGGGALGQNNPFPNMPEQLRQHYIKQCNELGISYEGKVYMSGLVREGYGGSRMDPEALVSSAGEIRRKLESRGWGTNEEADCIVNVKAREPDDGDDPFAGQYRVADSIVEERVQDAVASNPDLAGDTKQINQLRESTRETLSAGVT